MSRVLRRMFREGQAPAESKHVARSRLGGSFAVPLLALMLLVGCDRNPAPAPAPSTQSHVKLPPVGELRCDLSVVAPILPKRITHLTIDSSSNLYFLQETSDGSDTLFIVGSGDLSNALPLSAPNVLAAIGEKGTGNIQSIAAGADRNIYFYFTGGTNRKTIACLGRYETATGIIRILAREKELADKSDMGASLALARGDLIAAGRSIWLWLHHTDASAMFNLRPGDFPADGEITLPAPTRLASEDGTLDMTHPDLELAAGPGDTTLLLDKYTAALWKIDVTGRVDLVQTLVGLPKLLSAPGANTVGDIAIFAAVSDLIQPRIEQRVTPVGIDTHYPSLLILRDGEISAIPRDDFHARASFPLYTMQLDQILFDPGHNSWVGYDSASGQIVRLVLSPKRAP